MSEKANDTLFPESGAKSVQHRQKASAETRRHVQDLQNKLRSEIESLIATNRMPARIRQVLSKVVK